MKKQVAGLNHVMVVGVVGGAFAGCNLQQQLAAQLQDTLLQLQRFVDKRETAHEADSEHWTVQAKAGDGSTRVGLRHSNVGGRVRAGGK